MASLQALKKHLNSIRMTGQLAGAMKTVSAVKLSRMNQTLQQFSAYDAMCRQVLDTFGPALGERVKTFLTKLIPLYDYFNGFKV